MATEGVPDAYDNMEGYIGPTEWSKPYFSNHLHENPETNTKMLGHLNCGYLSTPGRPPTLEALKQHAQSLTYLISTLAPSTSSGEIDNENNQSAQESGWAREFNQDEAFDWLNNLQVPYDNIDKGHRRPLNSLVNLIKSNSDEAGVEFHCPMTEFPLHLVKDNLDMRMRPYQNHFTMLMHANECLERLDHECSAMGGLLSIIPTDEEFTVEHPELEKAKKTLVGQWLLYTQHLVSRMHELEIAYGNCLDLLANEAIVPAQHTSAHGPDGRSGREIVFPQDRWILANAGEDVFSFIHQMLDKKEAWLNNTDSAFLKQQVVGDTLRDFDREYEKGNLRGIAHVDLNTRFYRIKNSGHGPIFVLPAFSDRPDTAYTKAMEERPTVISLPTPRLGTHTTAWDQKGKDLDDTVLHQSIENGKLKSDLFNLRNSSEFNQRELERLRHLNAVYEANQGSDAAQIAQRIAKAEQDKKTADRQYETCAAERNKLRRELEVFKRQNQTNQARPPPEVKQDNGNYTMPGALFDKYENRSLAVDAAKVQIERVRNQLESLASQGHIDRADFGWLETIANCD
ncbi:uncharacterized protein GGS25DRAFT_326981 [Hypoxylon fragiforme]|uniref:uncharacterized protein n=1 Tax=Hypoxylon fragiforme TaxID=63214 RepID=UPI0020C63229|nr:uncharacterized protein GGS25DRAFT_326981 [Hypoxylon fragiforme]KAI2607306.1 hypothetical protein GGS25DRAFT_326981 [Hypoxylon fragiforme]